jgi:hypothetical protein
MEVGYHELRGIVRNCLDARSLGGIYSI